MVFLRGSNFSKYFSDFDFYQAQEEGEEEQKEAEPGASRVIHPQNSKLYPSQDPLFSLEWIHSEEERRSSSKSRCNSSESRDCSNSMDSSNSSLNQSVLMKNGCRSSSNISTRSYEVPSKLFN